MEPSLNCIVVSDPLNVIMAVSVSTATVSGDGRGSWIGKEPTEADESQHKNPNNTKQAFPSMVETDCTEALNDAQFHRVESREGVQGRLLLCACLAHFQVYMYSTFLLRSERPYRWPFHTVRCGTVCVIRRVFHTFISQNSNLCSYSLRKHCTHQPGDCSWSWWQSTEMST
jgi:hypothetical protein